jgi:L-ascorbate metabolism protein UlaG (beta-lactamase superfamily)
MLILVYLSIPLFSQCNGNEKATSLTAQKLAESLIWIKQSCFKLVVNGKIIYFDPLGITKNDSADIILITHPHNDHFSVGDISKISTAKTIIYGPKECKYNGECMKFIEVVPGQTVKIDDNLSFATVPAYNIVKTKFHPKEKHWVGYLLTVNGIVIYHSGDTERIPEMKNFTADIALLPLGQVFTMNSVEEAAESAKDVKAKIVIPMHWGAYEGTIEDAKKFKALLDGKITVIIKNPDN